MEHYAIRQKSTGKFLPASKRRMGFTNDIPCDGNKVPPRLFNRIYGAKNALRWWLQGPWQAGGRVMEFQPWDWDYETGDCYGAIPTRSTTPRDPEDMEIVTIKLEVV